MFVYYVVLLKAIQLICTNLLLYKLGFIKVFISKILSECRNVGTDLDIRDYNSFFHCVFNKSCWFL